MTSEVVLAANALIEQQAIETYYESLDKCRRNAESNYCDCGGGNEVIMIQLADGREPRMQACEAFITALVKALTNAYQSGREHGR